MNERMELEGKKDRFTFTIKMINKLLVFQVKHYLETRLRCWFHSFISYTVSLPSLTETI